MKTVENEKLWNLYDKAIAATGFFFLLCSFLVYRFSLDTLNRWDNAFSLVLLGVSCSVIAALLVKLIMAKTLRDKDIESSSIAYAKKSFIGMSIDGLILGPKTNYDVAIRMVKESMLLGNIIIEGNMTSDENFTSSGSGKIDDGNPTYNKKIYDIVADYKRKNPEITDMKYHKIYKSFDVETVNAETVEDMRNRQKKFDMYRSKWIDAGIQVVMDDSLRADFILIMDKDCKPIEAIVGVFYDEENTFGNGDGANGWLALYTNQGKILQKIHAIGMDIYKKYRVKKEQ